MSNTHKTTTEASRWHIHTKFDPVIQIDKDTKYTKKHQEAR